LIDGEQRPVEMWMFNLKKNYWHIIHALGKLLKKGKKIAKKHLKF
jgi:hypothetical protein